MNNRRPLIGVPCQTLQAIDGIPEGLPHSWVMNHRYFVALTAVGAAPVMVPLLDEEPDTLRAIYDACDGIFLAGGVDVDPLSYEEVAHELCGRVDPPRDRVELAFARWAREDGKPVLGVCRGMQIINVAAGGSLCQDTTQLFPGAIKHDYFPTAGFARDYLAHEIRLEAGTRLQQAFGGDTHMVNSMHHQACTRLGRDIVPSATAPDGVVEAIEGDGNAFLVGVQWHPEMLIDVDEGTRRLFRDFVEAAAAWRANSAAEVAG